MNTSTLYETLKQRKRPEDVAQLIFDGLGHNMSRRERDILNKAAKGSLKNMTHGYTSMAQEFASATGARKQIDKAIELFELDRDGAVDANDVQAIQAFIERVSPLLHKSVGENNFLADRLNRAQRAEAGMDISKRAYNKRWRLLRRIERKLIRFTNELKKDEFQRIAKHGLAHRITTEDFGCDINTACFIAYYNARCNLRSVFTNQSQVRPFDEISKMLLDRCFDNQTKGILGFLQTKPLKDEVNTTNWWAIAQIYPAAEVLARLTDEQKGQLLGSWTNVLSDISQLLGRVWAASEFNRQTMIVRRGNDSTTWNNAAGAWNKARDNWVNLLYAMGMEYVLNKICFGKVLRLMAADVAYWHKATGGGLDPNTVVWNDLPLPWEVFDGAAICTRPMVIAACAAAGINPETSGWVAPRIQGVAPFTPTPELVHGVSIGNPFLAAYLRKHKVFSGKSTMH